MRSIRKKTSPTAKRNRNDDERSRLRKTPGEMRTCQGTEFSSVYLSDLVVKTRAQMIFPQIPSIMRPGM